MTQQAAQLRHMKNWLLFLVAGAVPVGLVGVLLIAWWVRDISNDRKHTIFVNAPTPVFAGSGDEGGCRGTQAATVEWGTRLPVRRIRYLKDCATLDVVLPDGRKAYFVLGVGDVSVNPPLPTT
jgi:hypothetical protein